MNPDREIALHQFVQDQIGKPFDYGTHDCVTFAASALDLLTDGDTAEVIADRRESINELSAYIEKYGDIEAHIALAGGYTIPQEKMTTGDFVVCKDDEGESCGGCLGIRTAFNTSDAGVKLLPNRMLRDVHVVMRVDHG